MPETGISILMPKIGDEEKFSLRYQGLETAIHAHEGFKAVFSERLASYDAANHGFDNYFQSDRTAMPAPDRLAVVRDLTIPKTYDHALYTDNQAPRLVHAVDFTKYLRDKGSLARDLPALHPETYQVSGVDIDEALAAVSGLRAVVKPTHGMESSDVYIGAKQDIRNVGQYDSSKQYLVQECIDTTGGMPELGIEGVHNLRVISIGSRAVGGVARLAPPDVLTLQGDRYGAVFRPDELPEAIHGMTNQLHERLARLPGAGENVVAFDFMHGTGADGEARDWLCEANRRPLRVSHYDTASESQQDPAGMDWLSDAWDEHEAALLVRVASNGAAE